ncbi:MAG: hypothetical protein KF901_13000 [Myxococcales bacterium]|nr:hypothetical protein [Myxococcales bacterium]
MARPLQRPAFWIACVAFLAHGAWAAHWSPVWSEEVSVHASRGHRVLTEAPDGSLALEPSCAEEAPPRFVRSDARPVLGACVAGRTFPVMVTPYASGVPYWPLALLWPIHGGDAFRLRWLGLLFGIWALWAVHRVAARWLDERAGDLSVLTLAVTTQFAGSHALLVYYEVLPWTLLASATLLVPRAPPDATEPVRLPSRRIAAIGGLVGLALLANVKTVLLLAPVGALLLRGQVPWARVPKRAWLVGASAAMAPLLVMVAASVGDAGRGLATQVGMRLEIIMSHLALERFAREIANLLVYWSDLRFYADMVSHAEPRVNWPGAIMAALALAYCTWALGLVVWRGRGPWLAAACGASLWFYLAVSVLLYDQQPSANYAPIHAWFGLATGVALHAASARLGRRPWMAHALVALTVAAMGWVSVARLPQLATLELSINAQAERALAAHLEGSEAEGLLVTTTYNLSGVLDALGASDLRPTSLHSVLHACARDEAPDETRRCLAERWGRVLDDPRHLPLRAVIPTRRSIIDEPFVDELEAALAEATAARALDLDVEGRFATSTGVEVLRLVRVSWPMGAPAP